MVNEYDDDDDLTSLTGFRDRSTAPAICVAAAGGGGGGAWMQTTSRPA